MHRFKFKQSTYVHTLFWQMGTPSLLLLPHPPPACLTGVKEPIVIQSALPPPIVCDSWKPSELIQTSAHSTAPPPLVALSFLLFISLSLSLSPSTFPPPPLYVLPRLFKLSHRRRCSWMRSSLLLLDLLFLRLLWLLFKLKVELLLMLF